MQFLMEIRRNVPTNPFQSIPGKLATIEEFRMRGLAKVEKIGGAVHAAKVWQRHSMTEEKLNPR
jgi:hypothetical protein